jgi:hypothetical protein
VRLPTQAPCALPRCVQVANGDLVRTPPCPSLSPGLVACAAAATRCDIRSVALDAGGELVKGLATYKRAHRDEVYPDRSLDRPPGWPGTRPLGHQNVLFSFVGWYTFQAWLQLLTALLVGIVVISVVLSHGGPHGASTPLTVIQN